MSFKPTKIGVEFQGKTYVEPCRDAKGKKIVRTGVNVFVFNKKGEFVIGKRKGSHGAGTWGLPGGHIDFGEKSFRACAEREIKEETKLKISDFKLLTVTNDFFKEDDKHYTTNFFVATLTGDRKEPVLVEKDKCEGWDWTTWEKVTEQYKAHDAAIKNAKEKNIPFAEFDFKDEQLFLPMLSLFRQWPGLHPLKEYKSLVPNPTNPA
ncbi:Nudix hydrolase 15, mitochondrial [Aspergillus hancockii]|nr:Nudix hydrolase 15, mitochondrial [Aspergillus hancockii]